MAKLFFFTVFICVLAAPASAQLDPDLVKRIEALKDNNEPPASPAVPAESTTPKPIAETVEELIEEVTEKPPTEEPSPAVPNQTSGAFELVFEANETELSEEHKKRLLAATLSPLRKNARIVIQSFAHREGLNDNETRRLALERTISAQKTLEEHGISYREVDLMPKPGAAGQNLMIITLQH